MPLGMLTMTGFADLRGRGGNACVTRTIPTTSTSNTAPASAAVIWSAALWVPRIPAEVQRMLARLGEFPVGVFSAD
ncbi:hypothetical protein [Streptomyces albus]|uniref:hypothetical protein n=1 Tax=Streptomyces albus TaxID=1888 RepID=UPI003D142882